VDHAFLVHKVEHFSAEAFPRRFALKTCTTIDVVDLLGRVQAPTLVRHLLDDDVIPIAKGLFIVHLWDL
jgi:hypothetical protein